MQSLGLRLASTVILFSPPSLSIAVQVSASEWTQNNKPEIKLTPRCSWCTNNILSHPCIHANKIFPSIPVPSAKTKVQTGWLHLPPVFHYYSCTIKIPMPLSLLAVLKLGGRPGKKLRTGDEREEEGQMREQPNLSASMWWWLQGVWHCCPPPPPPLGWPWWQGCQWWRSKKPRQRSNSGGEAGTV